MKLKGVHIVILVTLVVVGLVVYAVMTRGPEGPAPQTPPTPPPIQSAEGAPQPQAAEATAPPATDPIRQVQELAQAPEAPPVDLENAPVLTIDAGEVFDAGVVPNEGVTVREFTITNTGKGPLEITNVASSCGCTKAEIAPEDKTLAPGAKAGIKVKIDPKQIHGFESRKTVTIMSNDPQNPRAKVDVLARVDPEFAVEPDSIDFGTVEKGAPVEKTVRFRQLTDERVQLQAVQPMGVSAQDMEVSFQEAPPETWARPDRTEYDILVRLKDHLGLGNFFASVELRMTCKRMPIYRYTVRGNATSFYQITPARAVVLRSFAQDEEVRPATATITADRPFVVADLVSSSEDILVVTQPGPTPNSFLLKFQLKEGVEPAGRKNEHVAFTIRAGDKVLQDKIDIRVFALNRKPSAALPGPRPAAMPVKPVAPVQAP